MAIRSSAHIALIVVAHPMSSVFLPPRGQCTQVTDNNQLCQCLSFASTLDQAGPLSSSPCIRAYVLLAHLLVWTWYSRACRLHFNVCPSVRCDELRCVLSECRCSLTVVSGIMNLYIIVDVPGTSMHMLGVSHRAYTGHKCVSFASASALHRGGCPSFQCHPIHRRHNKHLVHSGTHARSII